MTTQTPRLLVVDDSPEIAFLVERLAKGANYEVVVRADAASAWDYLDQSKPDLLLVDINLPGENGAALCRRVRDATELGSLAIAVFSHWQRTEDIGGAFLTHRVGR